MNEITLEVIDNYFRVEPTKKQIICLQLKNRLYFLKTLYGGRLTVSSGT
jgi:hypothetical protein